MMTLAEVEKAHILKALEECEWNAQATAKAIKIGKTTVYRKLKTYGFVGKYGIMRKPELASE